MISIRKRDGFTLVETLVGTAVFLMMALALYKAYGIVFHMLSLTRAKTAAYELAAERVEVVRNMPYAQIGITNGIPVGTLARVAEYSRSGFTFQATTTVRNIDDAFDGTITSVPKDTAPADYKIVEFEIGCKGCGRFPPVSVTTTMAPRSLESTTGNGALFVRVIDASGGPVSDATVSVVGQGTSTISLSDLSGNDGILQIIDVPPGSFKYAVTVSKAGYSSERTYTPGAPTNPNPINSHPTVTAGQATQLTFAIDKTATLNLHTVDELCTPLSSIPLTLSSSKKVGNNPVVLKYQSLINTGALGFVSIPGLEWDSYSMTPGSGYVISGSIPFLPFTLAPNETRDVFILTRQTSNPSLLVRVKDAGSGLPLSDATVTIANGGDQSTLVTSKGFLKQIDWSGGGGQLMMSDSNSFYSSSNIATATSSQMMLQTILGSYAPSGELISSWFDVGNGSSTLYTIDWTPIVQATSTGINSVRFQIESTQNIASTTTGFIGPDGTDASFYTATSTSISILNRNKRYVRYKAFLSTDSTSISPLVSTVSLTFATECTPFGQAFFSNLSNGTYLVTVSRAGYQVASTSAIISGQGQSLDVNLNTF